VISDAAITAAILSWLRSRSAGARSPMDAIAQVARLGTIIQSSRSPSTPLDHLEPWCVRLCSREMLAALEAKYLPSPPLTRWTREVLYTRGDGQIVVESKEVARWATDGEVAKQLGIGATEAHDLLIEARQCVRQALERAERDHLRKCE